VVLDLLSLEVEAQTSILSNIGLYSYGTALLASIMLIIVAFIKRRNNPLGSPLLVASCLSALWAAIITVSVLLTEPLADSIQLSEMARNAAWIFVLLRYLGLRLQGSDHILSSNRWVPWYILGVIATLVVLFSASPLSEVLPSVIDLAPKIGFSAWLAMSILGLLLLEQYFRNSNDSELWATKHLCVGLGILFAYDFFMYAEALLFQMLDRDLWQARGLVTTMAAILIATSVSRTNSNTRQDNVPGVHLSRHVAFHSLTLMASGIYLITMALAAYVIKYLGGTWGGVLQVVFLCASGLILAVLLFSGQIRAHVRVWLSKNFFSYKYDYRLEWLEFTRILASGSEDIPGNITRAVANITKSPAGVLWSRAEDGRFNVVANWEMPAPIEDIQLDSLSRWLQKHEWIIDIREWFVAPDLYQNLELPRLLTDISRAWLIIPLLFGDRLQGILLLRESDLVRDLNWEDRDLLKVAGKQAASHLAQYQADKALVESRQFEAFNRLSAYVIHDLKNILAQLSLIVANAQKHKQNPEFIDDMVDTVSNAVNRMSNLMAQLRSETTQREHQIFDLAELLKTVVAENKLRLPTPKLVLVDNNPSLECDRERLQTVFEHLVQNAQEATSKDGLVTVRLLESQGSAVVEIEDDGIGMDEHFVRHRLFRPFDSTKGLTGMGIGAFESRDFVRSIGGDISVQSTPGKGSLLRVHVPCVTETLAEHANTKIEVTIP
jgi:putative PEP-CTERM system histidine kinase